MDEIGDPQGGEPGVGLASSRRAAGAKPLLVKEVGYLGIDVAVEELVDEFDDLLRGCYLLRGGLGVRHRERLGLATLEADMDPGRSFRR